METNRSSRLHYRDQIVEMKEASTVPNNLTFVVKVRFSPPYRGRYEKTIVTPVIDAGKGYFMVIDKVYSRKQRKILKIPLLVAMDSLNQDELTPEPC